MTQSESYVISFLLTDTGSTNARETENRDANFFDFHRLRLRDVLVRTAMIRVLVLVRRLAPPRTARLRLFLLRLVVVPSPSRRRRVNGRRTPTPRMLERVRRRIPHPRLSLGEIRMDISVDFLLQRGAAKDAGLNGTDSLVDVGNRTALVVGDEHSLQTG